MTMLIKEIAMDDENIVNEELNHMDQDYQVNQTKKPTKGDRPFSKPDDIDQNVENTHQSTDTNVDQDEVYHEGLDEAAESNTPRKS